MKLDDIPFLIRDIKNEMPIHTTNLAKIPQSYSQGLPKNAMKLSHKVQNKFLNNHQAKIEEANHSNLLTKNFTAWYLNQNLIHSHSGILNHDSFFQFPQVKYSPDLSLHDVAFVGAAAGAGECAGADIELYGDLGSFGNTNNTHLFIMRTDESVGVVGECYDQIAIDMNSTNGNIRMGTYNETTTDEPDVLYAQTENSVTANYAFKSITEFTLTSVYIWFAFQPEGTGGNPNNQIKELPSSVPPAPDGLRWWTEFTYGTFPDPADSITWDAKLTGSELRRMKTGHT